MDTVDLGKSFPVSEGVPLSPEDLEARVLEAFRGVLGQTGFGTGDTFFASGGTSLMASKIILALRTGYGVTVPLNLFAQPATPAAVALFLRNVAQAQQADAPGADRTGGRAKVSLTF